MKNDFELEHPISDRLDMLMEFINEHDAVGVLDRTFWQKTLRELQLSSHVTRFRGRIEKGKWRLYVQINHRKELSGTGPLFEDAFINVLENFEELLRSA